MDRHASTSGNGLASWQEESDDDGCQPSCSQPTVVRYKPPISTAELLPALIETLEPPLAKLFSHMYGSVSPVLSLKAVQNKYFIMTGLTSVADGLKNYAHLCECPQVSDCVDILSQVMHVVKQKFSSHLLRRKYFTDMETYVPPIPHDIAYFSRRHHWQRSPRINSQFVSFRKLLSNLFHMQGLMQSVDDHLSKCMDLGDLANIVQCESWRRINPSTQMTQKCYPIVIFHNDLQLNREVGLRGTKNIGVVYMWLPFLPPELCARFKQSFLITLYDSRDDSQIRKNGNDLIFGPIVKELNFLSAVGININIPGYFEGVIRFKLAAVVGDCLPLRNMLGFSKNVEQSYSCWLCREHKTVTAAQLQENLISLRNLENYYSDFLVHDTKITGIAEKSKWLEVRQFDPFENAAEDIVQNLLDNVCPDTLNIIVLALVKKKYFDMEILNDSIDSVISETADSDFRPLSFAVTGPSKMSSTECLTFMRYFPIMVGDRVPNDDEYWRMYIVLRQILEISLAEELKPSLLAYIQCLTKKFNEQYLKLSGKYSLNHHFHILVHYPRFLRNLGPLKGLWEARLRAKYTMAQTVRSVSKNTKDVCEAIAGRYQWFLNLPFYSKQLPSPMNIGSTKPVNRATLAELTNAFDLPPTADLGHLRSVKYNGVTYRPGYVICTMPNLDDQLRMFSQISEVFVDQSSMSVYFKCWLLNINDFNEHLFAYEVIPTTETVFLSLHQLEHRFPHSLCKLENGSSYIVLRAGGLISPLNY